MRLPRSFVLAVCICAPFASARAEWNESGNVTIRRIGESGLEFVEAPGIGLDDDVVDVFIGNASETGTLTCLQQAGTVRTDLGSWTIDNGLGNVQAVYGDGFFTLGSGTQPSDLDGELELLASDVTGSINVRKGHLRVRAASKAPNTTLRPLGRADVVESSEIARLTTEAGSLAILQDAFANSTGLSTWSGSVRADDSVVHLGALRVTNGGDVQIGLSSFFGAELAMPGNLEVRDADLAVAGATVSTGSLDMRGIDSSLDVAGGTWTNAGILDFHPSGTVGPVTIDLHGGAEFHSMGLLRVSGHDEYQQLQVRGGGTELEVDGDLRIGEYVVSGPVQSFTGNVTVSDGAVLVVHGTLAVGSQAVLNIESGATVYANDVEADGTINENGGQLVLPEPEAVEEALAACAGVAAIARRSRAA